MGDEYEQTFIIEKEAFTKELCIRIAYSLLEAHKDELKGKNIAKWLEEQIYNHFYSGENGDGLRLPLSFVPSVWKVYDRNDDRINRWYPSIQADKAVIVVGTRSSNLYCGPEQSSETNKEKTFNINNFIKDSKVVYSAINPLFGMTLLSSDNSILGTMPTNPRHITWLTFFGRNLAKKFGREKILSAPAYKVEELSDGGILLMSGPAPYPTEKTKYFEEWNTIACQEKISKHFGLGEYMPKEVGK